MMAATLVGYCRCSTDAQDVTAQRQRLRELGVTEDRIYLDHGLTGTNRARPGLDQALAALREGDTLVVPKLDRLARSVPDARDIGDGLAARGIKFPWRPGLRPDRPDGKDVLQHPGHLCGIRSRLAAPAHPRRNRRRPCVGAAQGRRPKLSTKQQTEGAVCTAPATTPSPSSPNCSTSPDPPSTAPSQPWKLLLRNAAADNASSYIAFGSASGASER